MWDSFPVKALQFGVAGAAVIHCGVGLQGELFDCEVVRESPPGFGFGEAALKLAPEFLMTAGVPDKDGHRPSVNIPVSWGKPNTHPTLRGSDFGYLAHPHWLMSPSYADVVAAYPKDGGGAPGYVSLNCDIVRYNGRFGRCRVRMEDPPNAGFAAAAIDLTHKFQIEVPEKERKQALEIWAFVQVQFPSPTKAGTAVRVIDGPTLMPDADSGPAMHLFPPLAAQKGVTSGKGTAECAAGVGGVLQDCRAFGDGSPPGLGFSEAAVQAAKTVHVSPWTDAGQPVEGAQVRLSFQFTCPPN
jgi:hypothetical protein